MNGRVRLGDLITLEYGRSLPAGLRRPGNVPVYGSNGITGWHDKALIDGPAIVVGRKGSIGEVHYELGPAFPIDTTYYALPRSNISADTRFLFYMLCAAKLTELNSATGVPGLNREHAYRIIITSPPPLEEQRRIVNLLDRAAEIRRRADAARAKARAIIPALFLQTFGDPATNPKGWDIGALGRHADVQGGVQVSAKRATLPMELPYLRVANILRGRLDLGEIKTIRVTTAEAQRTSLVRGDVLIVEGHGNPNEIGRAAVWDGSIEICTHQNHLIRARPHRDCLTPKYLEAFLNSDVGRRALVQSGKTTSGLNTISTRDVKDIKLLLPPSELQTTFAECVHRLEALRRALDTVTAKAEAMAAALSAEVFGPSPRGGNGHADAQAGQ